MILKIRIKETSRKNIKIIKKHFFDDSDKVTAGYLIGLAVEKTKGFPEGDWKAVLKHTLHEGEAAEAKSTSVSLRQEIYERIGQTKEMLQAMCGRSLHMSQVIDTILSLAAGKLGQTVLKRESLLALEWNINARTGFPGYMIPVNLISNAILEKAPHIFVLTEFVKSVGWLDLKGILEEKYDLFDSPYRPCQNGVCIGIRKGCGIEFLENKMEGSLFCPGINSPDFYEVKVRVNSEDISVIGTRIQIDFCKADSKKQEIRLSEHKQRFEQYSRLVEYIQQRENVILLGDFNNSRILCDEMETNESTIEEIYSGKDSIEYNFQKIRSLIRQKTNQKFSLYTAQGDISSVGAFWDASEGRAVAPAPNSGARHKYDHLLTNYFPQKVQYHWDFLKWYRAESFTPNGKIKAGYPDHAILLAEIALTRN